MSLIMNESNFQHILRVLNTNLDGKVKVIFALTSIKGVGPRPPLQQHCVQEGRGGPEQAVSRAALGVWPWAEHL